MFSLFISNNFRFELDYSDSTGRLAHPTLSETSHIFIISRESGARTHAPECLPIYVIAVTPLHQLEYLSKFVRPLRLELRTLGLKVRCSNPTELWALVILSTPKPIRTDVVLIKSEMHNHSAIDA